MRASPACQISLRRFGAWRAAVGTVATLGAAVTMGWWLAGDRPVSVGAIAVLVSVGVLTVACVGSLWRAPALSLAWDGQVWQLDALPGDVSVAIDLGVWMMLRFRSGHPARTTWLPVQRAGLEGQWHALRCAVYSPRPATDS